MKKTYKPRKIKNCDEKLDDQLNIEEIVATGGDARHIYAMNLDNTMPVCPECGGPVKNHGRFKRSYIDILINEDENPQIIELDYFFYKYRCLDEDCPTVFQKPIEFARENARVTRRLEDHLMRMACHRSYSGVSEALSGMLTKQAVGQIVKRWTADKDAERRVFYTPRILGLMSFEIDRSNYVIAVDACGKEQRIIEVIPEVDSALITAFIRKLSASDIECVLTDCNPSIVDTVKSSLPKTEVLVDTDALMADVLEEFNDLIHMDAMHTPNHIKDYLMTDPADFKATGNVEEDENIYQIKAIRDALKDKERLSDAYDFVNRLRAILSKEWDATDIHQWKNNIPVSCNGMFPISAADVDTYWNEFLRYYMRRNEISGELYQKLQVLNEKINSLKRYSDEILRTRVLYLPALMELVEENEDQWNGVPLDVAIDAMNTTIRQMGEWKYGQY